VESSKATSRSNVGAISQVTAAMNADLQEYNLAGMADTGCWHCRKMGHNMAQCPEIQLKKKTYLDAIAAGSTPQTAAEKAAKAVMAISSSGKGNSSKGKNKGKNKTGDKDKDNRAGVRQVGNDSSPVEKSNEQGKAKGKEDKSAV